MTGSASEPPRARLFVALEPPAATRERIAAWVDGVLGADESSRLVGPDALHVTLAFLGSRPATDAGAVAAILHELATGSAGARLTPTGLSALPPRRPRVLAIDLDDRDGRAARLQEEIASALGSAGLHTPDHRRFRPHLTVARVRRGGRPPSGRLPDPPRDEIRLDTVTLYRSELRPDGARYTALDRAPLA